MANEKEGWEIAYDAAEVALVHAQKLIDDIAGWSGSSGNWPLQDASGKVRRALEVMRELPYPDDCQCHRALDGVKDGVWIGPCEDRRNHKEGCLVAARALKCWGVWNTALGAWLLGAAMTEADARQAAIEWNRRATGRNHFEAKREALVPQKDGAKHES